MLSTRGQHYADLDLAAGYKKVRGNLYDKTKHPDGLVSLGMAENFLMQEDMLAFIRAKLPKFTDPSVLTYHEGPFGSRRLRQAMADFVNRMFYPSIPTVAENITFCSGVTALNEVLALCLTEPNEGILLGMPIYGSFAKDFETKSNCKLVYVPFGDVDQFSCQAELVYERAFHEAERGGTRIRALLLSNPHNPLGRCYSPETLMALMRFCSRHKIHFISDEIYALSVYHTDETHIGFTSVLSIKSAEIIDDNLVHVLYGMSKDFAAAGLRLGCLITRNSELTKAVQSLARFHCAPTLSDAIATSILEDHEFLTPFLKKSQDELRKHQQIASDALRQAGIPFSSNPNAGFFLWINLERCLRGEGWLAEDDLNKRLYDTGLELSTGKAYRDERPGRFRWVFSVDEDLLKEGLRRLVDFYKSNENLFK